MKRRRMLIAAPAALALPTLRSVAQGLEAVPAPGPARPIAVPTIEGFALPNGLRVVIAVRRGVPLVTAQVLVLAGQEADGPGRAGLGATLATLLTKGARRDGRAVDAATLARQAEALGGGLASAAGWRSTTLGMTVTTPKLPAALALLADATQHPLLQAEELDRARLQALDGLRLALEQPGSVAEMAARRAAWGAGVYGQVTTPTTLQRLAIAELRQHHALHWRPDRAVLVLAGDIDAAGARPLAEAVFGGWARPEAAPVLSSGTARRRRCRRCCGSICPAAARARCWSARPRCRRATPTSASPRWRTCCWAAAIRRA
jgi:zinc protease